MKRLICAFLILPILFLLGCAPDSVSKISLTEREERLLDYLDLNFRYAFKYDVGEGYKSLKVWIETYKNGVKDESRPAEAELKPDGAGMIMYYIVRDSSGENVDFKVGISGMNEGSGNGGTYPVLEEESLDCKPDVIDSVHIKEGQSTVLAVVRYADLGAVYKPLPDDLNTNYINETDSFKDYPLVYLFCCKFDK